MLGSVFLSVFSVTNLMIHIPNHGMPVCGHPALHPSFLNQNTRHVECLTL